MASPDYKVVLHRKEHEPPDQVHDTWYFGMPRIYNRHDGYIVTPELKAFPSGCLQCNLRPFVSVISVGFILKKGLKCLFNSSSTAWIKRSGTLSIGC